MGRCDSHSRHGLGLPAGRAAPRRPKPNPRRADGAAQHNILILLGLAGWSGSGKTTLLTRLLPVLREVGLSVSTIKHTHHSVDLDQPGKDSFRHRQAGATEVMVVSGTRWALLRETPELPDLRDIAAHMAPVDLVLVEGFKAYDFPKIEVFRAATGHPPLWPQLPGIVAVATDDAVTDCAYPVLPLSAPKVIGAWIAAFVTETRSAA